MGSNPEPSTVPTLMERLASRLRNDLSVCRTGRKTLLTRLLLGYVQHYAKIGVAVSVFSSMFSSHDLRPRRLTGYCLLISYYAGAGIGVYLYSLHG